MNNRQHINIYASDIAPTSDGRTLWMDLTADPYGSVVKFWNGTTWVKDESDYSVSPSFTGIPTAPTATSGTNTTQIATTAFVSSAASLKADKNSTVLTGILEYADNDAAIAAGKLVGTIYRTADVLKIVHA